MSGFVVIDRFCERHEYPYHRVTLAPGDDFDYCDLCILESPTTFVGPCTCDG